MKRRLRFLFLKISAKQIELSIPEDKLASGLQRLYIDNECGDRIQTVSVEFRPIAGRLDVHASMKLDRTVCTTSDVIMFHGFAPVIRRKLARTQAFSDLFDIDMRIAPHLESAGWTGAFDVVSTPGTYKGYKTEELIGNLDTYAKIKGDIGSVVSGVFSLVYKTALEKVQSQMPELSVSLDDARFSRGEDGRLFLQIREMIPESACGTAS